MNLHQASSHRHPLILSLVCGLIFASFSFVYLYLFQGELLLNLYHTLSQGANSYSPFWGAFIITVVLCIVQYGLNLLTKFRNSWLAMSYFPAYLFLSFITCLHPAEYDLMGFNLHFTHHWWLFLIAILLYGLIIRIYRKDFYSSTSSKSLTELLIPNLITLIFYSFTTGSVGNSHIVFHHELQVAKCIRQGEYEKVLEIGSKSLQYSQTLTALRAYALSHIDSLGQCLFRFPQTNASNGLFMDEEKGKVSRVTNNQIEQYLGGASRKKGELIIDYLKTLSSSDSLSRSHVHDYYLCALLLEKELEEFHQVLLREYATNDLSLPRHYQEAVCLYQQVTGKESSLANRCSQWIQARYRSFVELQQSHPDFIPQRNHTRRKFGDTYWWYYVYGE